jgi:hypothetical protein
MKEGQIIIVEGKVDTTNTPPKILADVIRTEIKVIASADSHPMDVPPAPAQPLHYQSKVMPVRKENSPAAGHTSSATNSAQPNSHVKNVPYAAAESPAQYAAPEVDMNTGDDVPPPPDNFPDGWDTEWQPSFDDAALASKPAPKFKKDELITPPQTVLADSILTEKVDEVTGETTVMSYTAPSLYVPLAKANEEHPPRQITIILRASHDDKPRDKRRIQTLHGTLISFHGKDKFSFHIFESGKGHLIDFPNETTNICPELIARLYKVLGEECWRVEDILVQ